MRTKVLTLLAGLALAGCDQPPPEVASTEQSLRPCQLDDSCVSLPPPSNPPVSTICTSCSQAPHATPVAVCALVCSAGWGDCNHVYSDGCETALNTVSNCGACGHACSSANGATACVNGVCMLTGCASGFADCNGNSADGCETNLGTSSSNCGACGIVCSGGATCVGGVCSGATPICGDGICSPGEHCSEDCGCPAGTFDCCDNGNCLSPIVCSKIICP